MTIRKEYTGIDIFKLLAAVGVLAIHANAPFLEIIGRLGVPFFAITSSFFFFKHYLGLSKKEERKSYVIKFCKRIFYLYMAWQIIYLPLMLKQTIYIFKHFGGVNLKNILTYCVYFIFPSTYNANGVNITYDANGWGISWYLLATLVGIPLFLLIKKLIPNDIVLGFLLVLVEGYFVLANQYNYMFNFTTIGTHSCLRLLIYFYLGYLIVEYRCFLKSSKELIIGLLVIFLVIFVLINYITFLNGGCINSEETIMTAPTSFILTIFALRLSVRLDKPLFLRNMSTFIYCFQLYPIIIVRRVLEYLGLIQSHMLIFAGILVVSVIGYYIYYLVRSETNLRFLRYMV
ncbi:acyltransferase family protein [Limosilactobacillus panis]|uniref:Acyltransferase 3 domain-containing protein n=1 Tax=Limosilactobacillus panis DSM 6035 TaxID=1423782 RepID=A0A0R1XG19_9LACO|nr:acyltransferase family protein [Limosilactobacillus panis]KRM29066.1 hypothetical protein FD32_GL001548 [Limosilactobacillus panis DSM 6035]